VYETASSELAPSKNPALNGVDASTDQYALAEDAESAQLQAMEAVGDAERDPKLMELRMDTRRPPRRPRRPRALSLMIAAVMLLGVGAASAGAASSPIEGVWSFGGGQIAVQPTAGGTFTGTVVVATKFAECAHPVGQQIWTGMTLQPDGSYFGFHQWYETAAPSCKPNPTAGPTAWRVLEGASGSHYLRVCLSTPGTAQPTVAANGTCVGATYGGVSSALTAPLPVATSKEGLTKESLSLPSAKKCLSVRLFQIHLPDPKNDPLKKVSITIKGYKRKIATARKGKYIVATIDLKGLPKGAFTVKIKATTVLGHTLSASRTYHTCKKKIKKKK
jgi:hypothetical protein